MIRFLVLSFIAFIFALAVYSYFNPAIDAGIRLIDHMADKHEVAKVAQAEPVIAAQVGGDDRQFGQSINQFGAEDGARRMDREGALARARGETLPQPLRFLPAGSTTWLYTDIPIFECMHIWAAGEVVRGTYRVGPTGKTLRANREIKYAWNSLNGDRRTYMRAPWGAFIGKTCTDTQGARCGPEFVIGDNKYVSPNKVGGGHLWVLVNGFVSTNTDSLLMGIKNDWNLSDYNAYHGGYQFDAEPAPDKCR